MDQTGLECNARDKIDRKGRTAVHWTGLECNAGKDRKWMDCAQPDWKLEWNACNAGEVMGTGLTLVGTDGDWWEVVGQWVWGYR